ARASPGGRPSEPARETGRAAMKPASLRLGIVVSRFNPEITGALLESCMDALKGSGVLQSRIRTLWVPGAYEIPWAAHELALSKRYDAVICLGAVLKGAT